VILLKMATGELFQRFTLRVNNADPNRVHLQDELASFLTSLTGMASQLIDRFDNCGAEAQFDEPLSFY